MDNKLKDLKEGVSVKELGEFAKKHRFQFYFCLVFFVAYLFGLMGFFKSGWTVFFSLIGAIMGILWPEKIEKVLDKGFHTILKQDKTILFILAGVGFLLAIFIPFAIFFILSLCGGFSMSKLSSNILK